MLKMLKRAIIIPALTVGMIAMSVISSNTLTVAAEAATFKDVPKTHWAYTTIMEGVQKGYLSGTGNNVFKPNDPVTVAQFLKMVLLSMTEKDGNGKIGWSESTLNLMPEWNKRSFLDSSISFDAGGKGQAWYINYVNTAKMLYIIRDQYEERYDEKLTRERAADIINHLDNYLHGTLVDSYAEKAGPVLFKDYSKIGVGFQIASAKVALRGIMVGNAGRYFNPKSLISRAEAAKITYVLNNTEARNPQKIDMSKIPYATVNVSGYSTTPFVFSNWDMKTVYDGLKVDQKNYSGVTRNFFGTLNYYSSLENADRHMEQMYYFIDNVWDKTIYFDLRIGFDGNVYTLLINTNKDSVSRSSHTVDLFLDLVFKDKSAVKQLIDKSVKLDQAGGYPEYDKIFENRQVIISSTGTGMLSIGISAYSDKK